MRKVAQAVLVGLTCLGLLCPPAAANTAETPLKPLVLGVFAFRPKPIINERFTPLGRYLSEHVPGRTVTVVPMSNAELEAGVASGTVDFVLTNPTHYVQLRESNLLSGALATMVMRQGAQAVHGIGGVIIRRTERTDLRTLSDLKGQRIAIAGKHFLGTYMAPAFELQRAGVDLDSLNWVETTQPVDQVITSVLAGKADAGFVRTGVLEDLVAEGKLNPAELAIINPLQHPGYAFTSSTQLYPEWPFLAVAHVDNAISRLVSGALFNLKPEHPAAQAASIYGFSIPADYAAVEQGMRDLRMAPFDKAPPFNWQDIWVRYKPSVIGLLGLLVAISLLSLVLVLQRRRLLHTQTRLAAEHQQLIASTERFSYLMTSSPVMFYTLRVNRHRTDVSWVGENVMRLLGYTPEQAMQHDWWRTHLHPDDRQQALADIRQLHLTGHVRQTYRFADTQGRYRWFNNDVRLLNTQSGQMEALGVWRDVTLDRQQEDELQLAASVFDNSYDGIIITDAQHHIVDTNPAFSRITGLSEDEVRGRTIASLARTDDTHTAHQLAHMPQMLAEQGHWQGELMLQGTQTTPLVCALAVSAVRNSRVEVVHHVAVFSDISHIKAHQAELDRLAYYDPLTGIPNRRMLIDRLGQAIERSRRGGHSLAVCYLDLDDFKPVNDRLGHAVGDQLLISMTQRLQQALRAHDTLARLGGDEFVLLLGALTPPAAQFTRQVEQVGHKVLAALAQPYKLGDKEYLSAASMGVAMLTNDATPSSLLQQADLAMYQAKKKGGNTLCFFDPAMQNSVTERVGMEQDLRRALSLQQFRLHFQPQVNQQGHIVGAEALLRWFPTGRDAVSPGVFIPLAEENGLILPIGQWVLDTACQQLKAWQGQAHTQALQLAVNVSARQFAQPDFTEQVTRAIAQHGIDATRLKLEITESMVLNVDDVVVKMNTLRAVGVRFSMDDFGTGYSSLSSLTKLPLDQLKIDQSFVHNMHAKPTDAVIVRTIIAMAQSLGIEVIAEGVETDTQRSFLVDNGCLLHQGYLCGRPMAVSALEALLVHALPGGDVPPA